MKRLILASLLLSATLPAAASAYAAPLYFPHIATSIPWQTEIAIINTGEQTVTGILRALSDEGQLVETKDVALPARGRRQINIADEFTDHTSIAYIIFDTNSAAVQGYAKFSREGHYRAAIPAVREVNASDIPISHIAANADWWTGVSLVNTTSAQKLLTMTFNDGQSRPITLNANQHKAFDVAQEFFNNQPRPDIQSAVITNASGVIGLELFGNIGGSSHLDGILLSDKTASTIYYPHVAGNEWWTGIVAHNPSESDCTITITPYTAQGTPLPPTTLPLAGKGKYIGAFAQLGLPAEAAWFKIDSTSPITGFELFGTTDGNTLAAYAEASGAGAKEGVFAKIEQSGWTGLAFVNTEDRAASVILTAYDDAGAPVATRVIPVPGHAKVENLAEAIFSQNISGATYITYSSDRNVVGVQLNGSSDGTMLDGLPGLGSEPAFPPAVSLTRVAGGLTRPVAITHAGDGSGRLFVVEQGGRIRIIRNGAVVPVPFLDITTLVTPSGGEQGLLGLAFPPDFTARRTFYVDYTNRTGVGNTVIARFGLSADADRADPLSRRELLNITQPFANHNGGQLAFGPDGHLYIGVGDGGSGGDPLGNGQNLATLLGKILRIDVLSGANPYAIPPGNPFGNEVWAYGLRNPWRFSFDRLTGDFIMADVGQNLVEEVNFQPAGSGAGANYGWNIMEGSRCYASTTCNTAGLTLPVAEYLHGSGDCAVTGGYIYRGSAAPLRGIYFYGDFCSGRIWGLRRSGAGFEPALVVDTTLSISTFGEDEAGELYVADYGTGDIYQIASP